MPLQRARGSKRFGVQPGRFAVVHVGHHQHGGRVLVKPVRHFFKRQAHVFQADLLAHHIKRHGGHAVVHGAQHAREHGAIAHARVEQAKGRRVRMDVGQFHLDAPGGHPFFGTGVDEQQVFLAVVVKAEIGIALSGPSDRRCGCQPRHHVGRIAQRHCAHRVVGSVLALGAKQGQHGRQGIAGQWFF